MDTNSTDRLASNVVVLGPARAARGRDADTIRRYRIARLRVDPPRPRPAERAPRRPRG